MRTQATIILFIYPLLTAAGVFAQTASLGVKQRRAEGENPSEAVSREKPRVERNAMYERYSWITAKSVPPRTFKVDDLLTIIVRETRQFEADSELSTRRRYNIDTELDAFLKLTQGGVGAAAFQRGKPNVDYEVNHRLQSTGDASREDRLTMRLTAKIIDVKPNGLLVVEGRAKVVHDEEFSEITITGTCRKEDVTADNTVLSTQMGDKVLLVNNTGALRAASSRGWVHKLIDLIKPF